MNNKIEIKLNPLTDGFVENEVNENTIGVDRYTLIMATNGEFRFTDPTEGRKIIDGLVNCGGSMKLGKSDFHVLFNDKKAFDFDGGRFFVGSMLILKIREKKLLPFLDDEIEEVKDLLDGHMMTRVTGDQYFSALVVS